MVDTVEAAVGRHLQYEVVEHLLEMESYLYLLEVWHSSLDWKTVGSSGWCHHYSVGTPLNSFGMPAGEIAGSAGIGTAVSVVLAADYVAVGTAGSGNSLAHQQGSETAFPRRSLVLVYHRSVVGRLRA